MHGEIIRIEEARAKGLDHYFTGKPCKYGHIEARYLSTRQCFACQKERVLRLPQEVRNKYQRDYRSRNRERLRLKQRADRAADPRFSMLHSAHYRAKKRGLEFGIGLSDVVMPHDGLCPVLGIPMSVSPGKVRHGSPTLDRIDSSKGYVTGNVRVVSHRANTLKNNANYEEIVKLASYLQRESSRLRKIAPARDWLWVA